MTTDTVTLPPVSDAWSSMRSAPFVKWTFTVPSDAVRAGSETQPAAGTTSVTLTVPFAESITTVPAVPTVYDVTVPDRATELAVTETRDWQPRRSLCR